MRIGIDARFYGSIGKGLGRYTEKLLEHLEHIDTENEYVIFLRRENFDEYHPRNPHFKKVLAHFAWYGFAEQTAFLFLLYRSRLDLVHFPHFNVPFFYAKKFVVTIHDLILLHYPTVRNTTKGAFLYTMKFLAYRTIIASAIRRSSHVITVSHFTEQDILKNYSEAAGKITVTYEAADSFCQWMPEDSERDIFTRLGLLKEMSQQQNGGVTRDIIRPYFLYVGNAYPHKNLEILLTVAERMPEYTFVLVGKEDYFYGRLKREAKKSNTANVIFSGFVSDKDLSVLYRYGRLYIFPSLYEGFGLPPLEAMSQGLPVLSSDQGSLPEILGDAALFFDPIDPASLLEKINLVEKDETMRSLLRQKGYLQCGKYSFESMAEKTSLVYEQSLKQN